MTHSRFFWPTFAVVLLLVSFGIGALLVLLVPPVLRDERPADLTPTPTSVVIVLPEPTRPESMRAPTATPEPTEPILAPTVTFTPVPSPTPDPPPVLVLPAESPTPHPMIQKG